MTDEERAAEMNKRMKGVREALRAAIAFHDAEVHKGEPCRAERASMVAYLAIGLGLGIEHDFMARVESLARIGSLIADYAREHDEHAARKTAEKMMGRMEQRSELN